MCKLGPERCLVYLRLLWLGSVFSRFKKQAKSAVKQCFSAVELRFVYNINELLSATNKHVLLALQKSNVIYQFSCLCDSRYVSRNSHRLQDKIKLRVSKSIRSCSSSQNRLLSARQCKSSIWLIPCSLLFLIQPLDFIFYKILYVLNYMTTVRFSILAQGRSPFHLFALETILIKTSHPALFRQKKFYTVKRKAIFNKSWVSMRTIGIRIEERHQLKPLLAALCRISDWLVRHINI